MNKIFSILLIITLVLVALLATSCQEKEVIVEVEKEVIVEVPVEHVHTFKVTKVEPTCIEEGYNEYVCKDCGYSKRDTFVKVDPDNHNNGYKIVLDVAPTCREWGYKEYSCVYCKDSYKGDYKAPAHKWGEDTLKETLDCMTNSAVYVHSCLLCGDAEEFVKNNVKHDCSNISIIYPVYDEHGRLMQEGYILHTCDCGKHTYKGSYETRVVAPVCGQKGYTIYTCMDGCGFEVNSDYTDETGCVWGDWFETQKAVCDAEGNIVVPGQETRICFNCERPERRDSDTVSHACDQAAIFDFDAATVTHKCSCEAYADVYEATIDHVVAPGCLTNGWTEFSCPHCGEIAHGRYVDPTGHTLEVLEVVEPTCTAKGYTVYGCVNCDYTEENDYVDEVEHNYGEWVTIVEVVCDPLGTLKPGYEERTCEDCDHVDGRISYTVRHVINNVVLVMEAGKAPYWLHYCDCYLNEEKQRDDANKFYTTDYSDDVEFELRGDHYAVVGLKNEDATHVVIPAHITTDPFDGEILPVKVIDANAFANSKIVEVVIPETVVEIGSLAFSKCYSLTTINFQGTLAQWNAIDKSSKWAYNTPDHTVNCK